MLNDAAVQFKKYSIDLKQVIFQKYLESIFSDKGLEEVMNQISKWEYNTGYIDDSKLNDNLRFNYKDNNTGVVFRTQINYARSNYSPKPISGDDVPKLHCPICIENVGIPGKENLRVFEFSLNNKDFFAQLTPFPLFKNHFVIISKNITPMIMSEESVKDLVDFLRLAPNYTACSNSDVQWAGSSILTHHHYQVFDSLSLPIMEAPIYKECQTNDDESNIAMLDFPIASLRVTSPNKEKFISKMGELIMRWKDKVPGKNTCNLIIKKDENEIHTGYIIYRNPDHRTPKELTDIKSEGVGIIEVAGEGIYPVPKNDQLMEQIKNDGLSVIKGIIYGNNPIKNDYNDFFQSMVIEKK